MSQSRRGQGWGWWGVLGWWMILIAPVQAEPFLRVTIESLRNTQGSLCFALFAADGQGFPDQGDKAAQSRCTTIDATPMTLTLDLPYGAYGLTLFHDENNNGTLDTGLFGIPSEGFGFSNNPTILIGAPSFAQSRFVFDASSSSLTITMRYF